MRDILPFDVIVAHGETDYGYLSSAAVDSVMKTIGAPHKVREVLDHGELYDALTASEGTPIIISDPRSLPSLTVFSETPPMEDFVTTLRKYLHEDTDHRAVLLFGEDEMDRLPGAEETFERGMAGVESQYEIFRESGSMLRRSTVLGLILKLLEAKQEGILTKQRISI